jgi:CDP-paratose 2-epimerase
MTSAEQSANVLITGGAGFIGCNLADRLASEGRDVAIFDNFARFGAERNAAWLRERHGERIQILRGDIRDPKAVEGAVEKAEAVFHFAAQVAVTTSLVEPQTDFGVNVEGTFALLEALRRRGVATPLVFASTNKVYGDLADLEVVREEHGYAFGDATLRSRGISEQRALSFCTPYGCSKGAADQYVLDYARSFGLTTLVFRMSCIYGPRQFGTEDQGWVAHFILRALRGEPITVYGDGMQVRDILFVDDLVDAFVLAEQHAARLSGRAFTMGGGPANAISLLDLLGGIEELHGSKPRLAWGDWRTGDQRYYVSDTRAFQRETGWRARVAAREGIERLYNWLIARQVPPTAAAKSREPQTLGAPS